MAVGGWPLFLAAGFLLVIGVMLGVLLLGIFPGGEDPG